jgi:hypothetical protein
MEIDAISVVPFNIPHSESVLNVKGKTILRTINCPIRKERFLPMGSIL